MLTAAHCVVYKIGNTVVPVPIEDGILELIFGTWSSQNVRIEKLLKKGAATKRSIKKITVHEEYKYGVAYYDVAIIEFAEPLVFSPQIQPVCVPKSGSQVKQGFFLKVLLKHKTIEICNWWITNAQHMYYRWILNKPQ